jgi:outer membrane biosynthesis protein TonB
VLTRVASLKVREQPAPSEACCYADGSCADVDPSTCADEGGVAQGPGTTCAEVDCEATPTPTATAEPSPTPTPTPTEVPETPTPSPTPTVAPPPPTEVIATPPPEETPRPPETPPPLTPLPEEGTPEVIIAPAPGTPEAVIAPPPTGTGSPTGGSWPWWPLVVAGAAAGVAGVLLAYQGRRAKP